MEGENLCHSKNREHDGNRQQDFVDEEGNDGDGKPTGKNLSMVTPIVKNIENRTWGESRLWSSVANKHICAEYEAASTQ